MKTFSTNGTGSQQTLSEIESDKMPIYKTKQDAETDLVNLEEGQLVGIEDTGDELAHPVDTVQVGNLHAVTSNAVANAINNISSISSVLVSVAGHLGNMYLCKYGKVVFMSFNSDWTSLASGDNPNLATIPQGYRPIARCSIKEVSTTNATLYINEDGSVTCYNYGSAITQAVNGNYFACWITID